MNQFRVLLRVQMLSMGRRFTGGNINEKQKKKKSLLGTAGMAVLWAIAGLAFMYLFGMVFFVIAEPFAAMGFDWLYMTLAFLFCAMFMLVGTVFLAKSQLFEAKDNAILLPMPIPPATILLVRMTGLYLMNLLWGAMVYLPAIVIWIWFAGFDVLTLVFSLVLFFAVGLFALALSCLLGWVISRISAHIRNKTLVTVIGSVAFLAVYYWLCGAGSTKLLGLLTKQSELVAQTLGAVAPLYWIGNAAAGENALHFLLSLVILFVPFAIVTAALAKTFLSTVTNSGQNAAKKTVYRAEDADFRVKSRAEALWKRENAHLLSSAVYLLNAGIGLIFLVVGAVAVVWQWNTLAMYMTLFGWDLAGAIFVLLTCMMLCMVIFTAPSVSLEAGTLWQLRAMPVSVTEILHAKWKLHLVWCAVPSAMMSVVGVVFLFCADRSCGALLSDPMMGEARAGAGMLPDVRMNAFDMAVNTAAILILPQLFSAVTGGIGLLLGLKYPNLGWTNEAQVVKQGTAVMFSMFGNMAMLVLPALLTYFGRKIMPVSVWMLVWMAVFAGALFLVKRGIETWGVKKFEELPV